MSILIQNGTLICPEGPVQAGLRVDGGKIVEIGPALSVGDSQVIDATGKLVFPGFIDTHTHFEMNKVARPGRRPRQLPLRLPYDHQGLGPPHHR